MDDTGLIAIAQIGNAYKRHVGAPYAIDYRGHLRKAFKSIATKNQLWMRLLRHISLPTSHLFESDTLSIIQCVTFVWQWNMHCIPAYIPNSAPVLCDRRYTFEACSTEKSERLECCLCGTVGSHKNSSRWAFCGSYGTVRHWSPDLGKPL